MRDTKHLSGVGSMNASYQMDDHNKTYFEVRQDVSGILKEIERDRHMRERGSEKHTHFRKAFTIPDVVAIKILQDYGMDLHSPLFMNDPDNMKKLKYIIKTEYPYLMI